MPAARKRLCNERFRQAVRGVPPKEVKSEHARGEKIAVKRRFSWHIACIALRKLKPVVLSPRITFKTRRLFAKSGEEMEKNSLLF